MVKVGLVQSVEGFIKKKKKELRKNSASTLPSVQDCNITSSLGLQPNSLLPFEIQTSSTAWPEAMSGFKSIKSGYLIFC